VQELGRNQRMGDPFHRGLTDYAVVRSLCIPIDRHLWISRTGLLQAHCPHGSQPTKWNEAAVAQWSVTPGEKNSLAS
jgi:hypothetical protein